jgi:Tol biopolymer transport system component
VPLPDGDVLYSSFANPGKGTVVSVLGVQTGPGSAMVSLTTPAEDCGAPAVAADGVTVAMVCDRGQAADLEVATREGTRLSAPRIVAANCLCNSPSWSPSGDNLLYMNASDPDGNFGLWYIANAGSVHPAVAKRVTDASVDLDATSAAAWTDR